METHRPLPGIEIGDIGPKFGFQSKDNGYMYLKNVRIPRTNLLKRYIDVDEDGCFSMKGNPKVLYSIMMSTRLHLIRIAPIQSATCIQMATKYAYERKQFKNS